MVCVVEPGTVVTSADGLPSVEGVGLHQREAVDGSVEAPAIGALHDEVPFHGAEGGLDHRPAGVGEVVSRSETRGLADHARPLDLLHPSHGVGDDPAAVGEARGLTALVGDHHLVGEREAPLSRLRALGPVARSHDDTDAFGLGVRHDAARPPRETGGASLTAPPCPAQQERPTRKGTPARVPQGRSSSVAGRLSTMSERAGSSSFPPAGVRGGVACASAVSSTTSQSAPHSIAGSTTSRAWSSAFTRISRVSPTTRSPWMPGVAMASPPSSIPRVCAAGASQSERLISVPSGRNQARSLRALSQIWLPRKKRRR